MTDLLTEARRFRAEAIRTDSEAFRRLARSYATVYRSLNAQLGKVTARIAEAQRKGETVGIAMLYQEGRFQTLRAQALKELAAYAGNARSIIGGAIDTAAEQGAAGAHRLVNLATPPPIVASTVLLPTESVAQMIALSSPGTPLGGLLASIAPTGAETITNALITGVAAGHHPTVIARNARQALGGNLTRALTISRTEVMRAHRTAAREVYARNSDVVEGWTWVSALDDTTCAECWAMHGETFSSDEDMDTHPNCRCTMTPLTRSWADLGFSGMSEPAPIESGSDVFRRASEATQRAVLGPSKFAAYRGNRITLPDLVAVRHSPTWGRSRTEASLAEAKTNAAARRAA